MARISVIGAGSWGMAIAKVLETNGHEVIVWSHRQAQAEELAEKRENASKLPGVKLSKRAEFTSDLKRAVRDRDLLVLAVPSTAVRSICSIWF